MIPMQERSRFARIRSTVPGLEIVRRDPHTVVDLIQKK